MKTYLYKLITLLLLFSSCAPILYINRYTSGFETDVKSFGDYSLIGKTFYIASGDRNISSNDVEFREYAKYVKFSMELQGAIETQDTRNADMCILLNYGISNESYTETIPVPIWGQTGISSISTTSTTTGSAYGNAYGSAARVGNTVYGQSNGSVYGSSTTNTTTRVTPRYGVTGYSSVDRRVSRFCCYLNIYAYDNKQIPTTTMLWKTNISSCGSSNDLRRVIPYMAYSAWGYMGISYNENESWAIMENDALFLRWRLGTLTQSNITVNPIVERSYPSKNMTITIVEKLQNETIVLICKSSYFKKYAFPHTMHIEYSGQKYYLRSIDNYRIGAKIVKENGMRYIRLHFPAIPSDAHTITISCLDGGKVRWNNWFEWRNIQIR